MIAEKENRPFIATTPGVVLACLASCFLWGSAFPCVKIGYELFGIDAADVPSILAFAGTRFVIAGLMVVAGMSVARRRAFVPERRDLSYVGALAIFQTILQYILFYVGLANCAGVTSSILEASNSFLCVLLAALVFRSERLTSRKVLGCVIGFAGVVLVNVAGETGGFSFTLAGEGMVLASTLAAATSTSSSRATTIPCCSPDGSSSSAARCCSRRGSPSAGTSPRPTPRTRSPRSRFSPTWASFPRVPTRCGRSRWPRTPSRASRSLAS